MSWMVKIIIIISLIFFVACGGGGGGGSNNDDNEEIIINDIPSIESVTLYKIVNDQYVETTNFDIGDLVNFNVIATDLDFDMDSIFISQQLLSDTQTSSSYSKISLPPQTDTTMHYFLIDPVEIFGPVGQWRGCWFIVDHEGNESNEICLDYFINQRITPAIFLRNLRSSQPALNLKNATVE